MLLLLLLSPCSYDAQFFVLDMELAHRMQPSKQSSVTCMPGELLDALVFQLAPMLVNTGMHITTMKYGF
jgi:hypothetical protein